MFGDPEFVDIKAAKQMGTWPDATVISTGLLPYLKRLNVEKPNVLLYGLIKGEDVIEILDKTKSIVFGYEKFKEETDKTKQYVEVRNKNLKDFSSICDGRFSILDTLPSNNFDATFVNMNEVLDNDLKQAYDTVKSNGIFGGNYHDTDRVKTELEKFRKANRIGTPILISKNTMWFWYKR